ncbi:MAG: P1 family peptidase [Chloroflexi bacterium]|nr:P1 family peptidase [Chloroflexota bacterium]
MSKTTIKNNTLTRVPGIKVGHYTDAIAATGCTVVLCPPKTVGAVDVRGGAPGTRETDLLQAHNLVAEVTAIVLSGGSAFGLSSADGVMRWHIERGLGYQSRSGLTVPIVPAAILFDLGLGRQDVFPDGDAGYQACQNAATGVLELGSVGAGTGAKVGAIAGNERASKGGIGSAAIALKNGLVIAALMAVNAVGNVYDERGEILAGLRKNDGAGFDSVLEAIVKISSDSSAAPANESTVIGVVATNGALNKTEAQKVAQMAHDGIARAVNPAHTMYDGDTIFALATGEVPADTSLVGAYAAEAVASAIRDAVRRATSLGGVRAIADG